MADNLFSISEKDLRGMRKEELLQLALSCREEYSLTQIRAESIILVKEAMKPLIDELKAEVDALKHELHEMKINANATKQPDDSHTHDTTSHSGHIPTDSENEMGSARAAETENNTGELMTDEGWQQARGSKNKNKNKAKNNRSAKAIKAAPPKQPKTRLYIGGVHASNEPSDIQHFLRGMEVEGDVKVRTLTTKGEWRSFYAELPEQDAQPLCAAEKWPTGIVVRPFKPSKRDDRRTTSDDQHKQYRRPTSEGAREQRNSFSSHPQHHVASVACCNAAHHCCC